MQARGSARVQRRGGCAADFPGRVAIHAPPHLATSMNCGTGWEKRQETSVCLSIPPTLRNEDWKSI